MRPHILSHNPLDRSGLPGGVWPAKVGAVLSSREGGGIVGGVAKQAVSMSAMSLLLLLCRGQAASIEDWHDGG